jgi:hypothetical protein
MPAEHRSGCRPVGSSISVSCLEAPVAALDEVPYRGHMTVRQEEISRSRLYERRFADASGGLNSSRGFLPTCLAKLEMTPIDTLASSLFSIRMM